MSGSAIRPCLWPSGWSSRRQARCLAERHCGDRRRREHPASTGRRTTPASPAL
jgi:hypothetical protein